MCNADYKGVGSQYVDAGKLIIMEQNDELHGKQSEFLYEGNEGQSNSSRCDGLQRSTDSGGYNMNVVRRLTPMECERLQGFPDGWTDIGEWTDTKGKTRQTVDSARYKALGNSIALPFWEWMARRMARYLPEGATMASLFDGIGGFPLVFSRAGVKPVWGSEIEEFPIAVTKLHFKEKGETYEQNH